MDDKIMLNDEELNKVSGGLSPKYANYSRRKATYEERIVLFKNLCPCCGYGLIPDDGVLVCRRCRILWKK